MSMSVLQSQEFIAAKTEKSYYADHYRAMEDLYLPDLSHRLDQIAPTPRRVLDIGPGWGTQLIWFASRDHQLTAMDLLPIGTFVSADTLQEIAQKTGQYVAWTEHDILKARIEATFDLILASQVIPHLKFRPDAAMRHIAQMLDPKGVFVCVVLDRDGHPKVAAPYDRWEELPDYGTGPGVPEMVTCMYDAEGLRRLLRTAFGDVSVQPLGADCLIGEGREGRP